MASPPRSARRHAALSALLARRAAAAAQTALKQGRPMSYVAGIVATQQAAAATLAQNDVAQMLAEQGIEAAAEALLNAWGFTTSADKFISMVGAIEDRSDLRFAVQSPDLVRTQDQFDSEFDRLVASLVQDAGRAAEVAATAVRDQIVHVRMLTPPSCSRCAVLAGRIYRYSSGFLRHPNCFPAGTVVSGPSSLRASRRWYEGELLTLRTASGKKLSVTPNHPILTSRGWVPADLLVEGDEIVSRAVGDRTEPLLVPDEHQVPSRIEDVWRSGRMDALARVPVAPEDFHGDGLGSSDVDVVPTDRLLRRRVVAPVEEETSQQALSVGAVGPVLLAASRVSPQLALGSLAAAGSSLRGSGARGSFLESQGAVEDVLRFAGVTNGDLRSEQAGPHSGATYPQALADRQLALALRVGVDYRSVVEPMMTPRWDAPAVPFSMQSRVAYAEVGQDLRSRLAGQVTLDRLVEKSGIEWSGHVYNLTSSEGWYDAEGLIVSNCDCVMIPTVVAYDQLVQDPVELMRQGLVSGLSKADQQAIADGADFNKVVNTRLRRAGLQQSGRVLARRGRLTPEGVYATAGDDRERAVELLTDNGYILRTPTRAAPGGSSGGNRGRGGPPAPPAAGQPDDWAARQRALGIDTGGDTLEPHEIGFLEKFLQLGHRVRWIPRDRVNFRPTNDFVWLDNGMLVCELKSSGAKYQSIRNHIHETVRDALEQGVAKTNFIVDIGDRDLTAKLRRQLEQYNRRREDPAHRIDRLWVMSRGVLHPITLK